LPEETSVTVRFTFSAFERTLTMDEVQKNIETITNALKDFDIKARF
jgi:phenylalanyl-tRNA synthetase beta subunit